VKGGGVLIAAETACLLLLKLTQIVRFEIWSFAFRETMWTWTWLGPVFGTGLGGWSFVVPMLQLRRQFSPTGELWSEAHNDWLQFVYETGLVGLVLLAGWLWSHRGMFRHPVWGGSLAAIAVQALGWNPFHLVTSALVAIVILGCAQAGP
jgi:hypothetical protein